MIFACTLLDLMVSLATTDDDSLTDIYLTKELPSSNNALQYLQSGRGLRFCTLEKNSTVILSVASDAPDIHLENYLVFDGKNMTNSIGNLYNLTGVISSKSGCFIVYNTESYYLFQGQLFVTILPLQYKTCTGINVFTAAGLLTVISTSKGPCEMIILADSLAAASGVPIKYITSNSSLQLTSYKNNRHIYTIPQDEVVNFKYFGLYLETLSILIPPSSKLVVKITPNYKGNHIIFYESGIQKGIMNSPSFSGNNQGWDTSNLLYTIIANNTIPVIKILVTQLNGSGILTCDIGKDDLFNLYASNTPYIFRTKELKLFFRQFNNDIDYFFIEYVIDDKDVLDTTYLPTTDIFTFHEDTSTILTTLSLQTTETASSNYILIFKGFLICVFGFLFSIYFK